MSPGEHRGAQGVALLLALVLFQKEGYNRLRFLDQVTCVSLLYNRDLDYKVGGV